MKKTAFSNKSDRRQLKVTLVPALLMTFCSLAGTHTAFANGNAQTSPVCSSAEEKAVEGCRALEGTWLYTVSIPEPPEAPFVFLGTETYDAGGGYTEADQLSFTPGYLATAGHGAWQPTSNNAFLLTYVNLTYDKQGNPTGSSKVRQRMRLTDAGTKYYGSGDFFYYDLNGKVVGSGTFSITAKKVGVEKPAS